MLQLKTGKWNLQHWQILSVCIILIIVEITFPQAEVVVCVGCADATLPPAANSSARPQEQFLQAFLLPVVPHTSKQTRKQLPSCVL
jgi:hypothetical protein